MPARRRANILSRVTKIGKDDQGNTKGEKNETSNQNSTFNRQANFRQNRKKNQENERST